MPSWSIHLAIANKINKQLKIDKDLFLFGNLIPDVDKTSVVSRYNAHYYDDIPFPCCKTENMINIDKFLKDYKNNIKDPLILGYYCHLLTDNFYNNIVYSKCWVKDENDNVIGIKFKNNYIKKIDIVDKKRLKRKYKHKDFELYGKYLYNDNKMELPSSTDKIKKHIGNLKNNFYTEHHINTRISYLSTDFEKFNKLSFKERMFKHNYKLFTKEELDLLLKECVEYILSKINEVDI